MQPVQVEQTTQYAVLRYSQIILTTILTDVNTLIQSEWEVFFNGAPGTDKLEIPNLGKPKRRTRIRLNPSANMRPINTVSGNIVSVEVNALELRTQSELAILYDGTGIINESMSRDFTKEFFRDVNEIQFTSSAGDLLLDVSHPIQAYAPNANININMAAATARGYLLLAPEIILYF